MTLTEARTIAAEYDAAWRAMRTALDRYEIARPAFAHLVPPFEADPDLGWPPEATATPPEYPFKLDRHVYGEPASAWRKRAGLD